MSEEIPETKGAPAPETQPVALPSQTERIFVRLTFWQTVLSVAGVFIAVVALYAALKESAAVRQQTAAAVWPFVQISIEDYDSGDTAGFTLSMTNAGVGPARVRMVRLTIDGAPARDWVQAVARVGGDPAVPFSQNAINNRVLSPDERVELIRISDAELARRFQAAVSNPENFISYCYCSIFDECWLADSRANSLDPEPVDSCPDFGDATFRN